jgi:hypothetical protein
MRTTKEWDKYCRINNYSIRHKHGVINGINKMDYNVQKHNPSG